MKNFLKENWLKTTKRGFIQIPILVIIILAVIASAGTGFILHKTGKLTNLEAGISNLLKNKFQESKEESKKEEPQEGQQIENLQASTDEAATSTPELSTQTDIPLKIQATEKAEKMIKPVDNSAELERAKLEAETQRKAREEAERKATESELQQKLILEAKNKEIEQARLKAAELEAQQQAIREAIAKAAELEAQQQAIREAIAKAAALKAQQEAEAKQKAEAEATALQAQIAQKQAILAQMQIECDNPINQWKQEILNLKSDYYIKVKEIQDKPISMSSINGQIDRLTSDTNMAIEALNNKIQQKALECSIKYGN